MECDKPHPKSSHPLKTVTFVAKYIFLYKFKIYTYLSSCFQENTYTDAALYCLGFQNSTTISAPKELLKIRKMKRRQLLSLHKLLPGQEDNKALIHTQTTR
jgi:hypothetical protein